MMDRCSVARQPPASQSPITVHELRIITGTLATVLKKSFGPKGQSTLFVSNTGQASMVKDGRSTLLSLHMAHPVAKIIQQAVKSLSDSYGDGCKTMVISIDALFCVLEKEISKQTSGMDSGVSALKNHMAKALNAFFKIDLPPLLVDVENFIQKRMRETLKSKDISWILFYVVHTFLSGCIPYHSVTPIAEVIVEYLSKYCASLYDHKESIHWLSSSIFFIPNKLYSSSYVEKGVFLQRPLIHKDREMASINLICMLCTIDGVPSHKGEKDVCLVNEPEKILQHGLRSTERFLTVLRDQNVSLIICNSKVPSYAIQLCQVFGIAVIDCVEESDIDFICYITGKSPVISCSEDITCDCQIKLSSCTQLVDGLSIYSRLVFEGNLHWQPRSMFLCAPSEALAKHLKEITHRCMIIISHLLSDNHCSAPFSSQLNDGSNNNTLLQSSLTLENSSENLQDNEDYCRLLKNVVCGGGYFEMVLCQFLCDMKSKNVTCTKKWCCDVLMEMLISAPKNLYHNLSNQREKFKGWLEISRLMKDKLRFSDVYGLNAFGQPCRAADLGIIEVLNVKIAAFWSAISLAVCLLNMDTIVSVQVQQP